MTVPDFMPVLSSGEHSDPRDGACAMEYISVLAGEKFSDRPRCTNESLASRVITANDHLRDNDRHLLMPLIPRIVDTPQAAVEQDFAQWNAALREFDDISDAIFKRWKVIYTSLDTGYPPQTRLDQWMRESAAEWVAALTALLDAYDRISGRTEVPDVDLPALRARYEALAAP